MIKMVILFIEINSLIALHEMVNHTKTIRQKIADELFECLTILWNWRLKC